ncbi:hypothetical protein J5N97_012896 [Dioscorea zingiberensis]|uniref:Uncharacterized protein n=1 Tax=Dioscorea zingiberensis TaxID=325984 RepID=A0A9D5CR56_9LILI|nr:hypothetical protein J5N97_012896 [Dioscorea zingiberensis]
MVIVPLSKTYVCLRFRCRGPFFGATQSYSMPAGHDQTLSKARVAADYSDSVPDSPKYVGNRGYHPLEELKDREKDRDMLLTDAEIARTTVEAKNKAVLVFPGRVHHEPHGHASWAEFQYVVDDYGDMFFEFFEDENILEDHGARNPVTVLIGLESPIYLTGRIFTDNYDDNMDNNIDILYEDEYYEVDDMEIPDLLIKWGMPEAFRRIHPMYFAKSMAKVVQTNYEKKMDRPSNGVAIVGYLRPAFYDEESCIRRLFHHKDSEDYESDYRDESENEELLAGAYDLNDGELFGFHTKSESNVSSTIYKLEIMTIELFSMYGDQTMIDLQDFLDAEPDVLAHSSPAIIDRFGEYGLQGNLALKALCRKKKGLIVERANLIGVDSLGMDVRVFSGSEAKTLRFSFNARALSESAAEKKIKRMLFPRYHRRNSRISTDGGRD